jgi:hypothetical protein
VLTSQHQITTYIRSKVTLHWNFCPVMKQVVNAALTSWSSFPGAILPTVRQKARTEQVTGVGTVGPVCQEDSRGSSARVGQEGQLTAPQTHGFGADGCGPFVPSWSCVRPTSRPGDKPRGLAPALAASGLQAPRGAKERPSSTSALHCFPDLARAEEIGLDLRAEIKYLLRTCWLRIRHGISVGAVAASCSRTPWRN